MARSKINHATFGLSGRVNLFVYRQRFGKTVISSAPNVREKMSATQTALVSRFKLAVIYAKKALSNLSVKAAYQAKAKLGQTAYNVAIADFFNSPVIGEIDLGSYNGQPGNIIKAEVMDDFEVAEVKVKIETAGGILLEQGNATQSANGYQWEYAVTVANSNIAGCVISINAKDRPGHEIVKQKTV